MPLARERPRTPALPPPAPLPSLTSALSRRAALFGAVTATSALAGSTARALPLLRQEMISASDADLVALADELDRTLDGAAYAMEIVHDEADQNARLRHADALTLRIVSIAAAGPAGLKAKGKAYLDSASHDVMNGCELATSLAEDVERLNGGAGVTA